MSKIILPQVAMREMKKALTVVYVMLVVMFAATLYASQRSSKLSSANLEPSWKDSLLKKTAYSMALGRMLTMLTSLRIRLLF